MFASKAQKAAEWIGALTQTKPETALFAAKMLRMATDSTGERLDLWPSPGRGVRNAPFTPRHLTNLLLALGCGIPIKAAETVRLFRGLVAGIPYETRTEVESPSALLDCGHRIDCGHPTITTEREFYKGPVLPTAFGEALDFIVETLAKSDADEESIRTTMRLIRVVVTIEPRPGAEIILRFANNESLNLPYELSPRQPHLRPGWRWIMGELNRVYQGNAFEALAIIWDSSKAASEDVLPSQQRPSTNENAAPAGAASRRTSQRSAPNRAPTPQTRSPNTCLCDDCACWVHGNRSEAVPSPHWEPTHAGTDHHARPWTAGFHERP